RARAGELPRDDLRHRSAGRRDAAGEPRLDPRHHELCEPQARVGEIATRRLSVRVESFLLESARRFPDKTALVAGPERLSYAQLARRAGAFAGTLKKLGLARGERVVIFLHNSPEAIVAVFGALMAGGVFSVVNHGTD